jgi:superfamily II DNA or RNA helicase
MKTLRTDQAEAVDNLRTALCETRRVVLQGPTGFGKTVVAADIIGRVREKDKRALITVPALSLVDQTVEALYAQGVTEVGVIQANHEMTDWSRPVQVASVQTLARRDMAELRADVVLVDECHKWFKFFERWFAAETWRRVPFIGLSATPWLKGLGAFFDRLVVGNTIAQMIADKTLAPFRVFAASHPDLSGVRIDRQGTGDYVENDLHEVMGRAKLVADIVQAWKDLAQDRPTICFAVNRDHAAQLAKEFAAAGVASGYMDCETPTTERKALREQFKRGDIQVMCNVDVIGLGVDWPEVACISYCRPTRSEMRFVQNIGRGLRTTRGKDDLIVIDHSDSTLHLGFVSDIHHPELDDGQPKINGTPPVELPNECPRCHYVKPKRTAKCPNCGHVAEHHAKTILVDPGTLREVKPEDLNRPKPVAQKLGQTFKDKARVYGQLMWYQRKHNKSEKFATANYKEIYGVWPRVGDEWENHFEPPDMTLASWLQSKRIAWAKRRDRWGDDNVQNDRPANGNGHAEPKGAVASMNGVAHRGERIAGTLMDEQDMEDFR